MTFGQLMVLLSLGVVAVILLGGLTVMAIGGETAKTWSNRLMRYRILAQLGAILIIMIVLFASGR